MNIKELRIENGLTQKQFAEKLGVTKQSVSFWETGRAFPCMNMVKLIEDKFGVKFTIIKNN